MILRGGNAICPACLLTVDCKDSACLCYDRPRPFPGYLVQTSGIDLFCLHFVHSRSFPVIVNILRIDTGRAVVL